MLWLGVQLVALSAAALRVPLAANYPQPGELLAPHVVLIMQVAASALLFPYLMRDAFTALAVIATAWPFAAVAAALAAIPARQWMIAEGYVTAWMVGLALWRAALRGSRAPLYGVAIATLITIGTALTSYLGQEFGGVGTAPTLPPRTAFAAFGPINVVIGNLSPKPNLAGWLVPGVSVVAGLAALLARHVRGRASLSTIAAPPPPDAGPIMS